MSLSLPSICSQLRDIGHRRLLVLSGDCLWVNQTLKQIQSQINGDWLTISAIMAGAIPATKAHLLLGREFLHGVFDAREGLHSEALAILAGTLKAGSLLVLCTPPQDEWAQTKDIDSLRWNEQHGLIATPHFIQRLQKLMQSQPDVLIWQQERTPQFTLLSDDQSWQPPTGAATAAQQVALDQLLMAKEGVWGVIAARGRGKSTLAGMLVKQWQGECWCCAPAKAAIGILEQRAGKKLRFWSPDELLRYCDNNGEIQADWLIIDEAAAIPNYLLQQLIAYFPRTLLTTTVDGYEGTGRGFINKFCAQLANFTALELNDPIRWANNDPLEKWLNHVLLLQEPPSVLTQAKHWQITSVTQAELVSNSAQLNDFYGLLASAHYRTSPLDLRRLLDASHQQFKVAKNEDDLLGALWMVEEGGLDSLLSWQVWAGTRRPRGNLLVQSLAAHSYFPQAAQMQSQRVMRIAVDPAHRRQNIGLQLLNSQQQQANQQGIDFLSVSFGLTPDLLAFWRHAGYRLVRVGSHLEASSGCYSAMAILPLSMRAKHLCDRAELLMARDIYWRCDLNAFQINDCEEQILVGEDWLELVGFAFYSRSLAASSAAIQRLLACMTDRLPLLRCYFQLKLPVEVICQQMNITGQKQWLKQARIELQPVISREQPQLITTVEKQLTVCRL